ncbi:MAG: YdcF family protein [Acidimicrobiales bacterium]
MIRLAFKLVSLLISALVIYLVVTAVQIFQAAHRNEARPTQAIVVLGAAQYNGVPSPDLKGRLDHALSLWRSKLAPLLVVTGGGAPGDRYTEATASADYLIRNGVPDGDILREVSGRDTYQSLDAASGFLKARGVHDVLLVTDGFHCARVDLIAGELGLKGYSSPVTDSPIRGSAVVPYYVKETLAVAAGRIIGFRRENDLHSLSGMARVEKGPPLG